MRTTLRRRWCLALIAVMGWSAAAMAAGTDFGDLLKASRQALAGANAPADAAARLSEIERTADSEAAKQASGSVQQADGPMDAVGTYGITRPLVQTAAPGRAVYVWPMPAGAGLAAIQGREFTYNFAFQHAQAGPEGAVYFVLYADTDGDGVPDMLMARSPLAQSAKPGGWTRWSCSSADHLIFVGVVFVNPANKAYFAADENQKDNWNAPDRKALAAEKAGELPRPLPEGQFAAVNLQVQIEP